MAKGRPSLLAGCHAPRSPQPALCGGMGCPDGASLALDQGEGGLGPAGTLSGSKPALPAPRTTLPACLCPPPPPACASWGSSAIAFLSHAGPQPFSPGLPPATLQGPPDKPLVVGPRPHCPARPSIIRRGRAPSLALSLHFPPRPFCAQACSRGMIPSSLGCAFPRPKPRVASVPFGSGTQWPPRPFPAVGHWPRGRTGRSSREASTSPPPPGAQIRASHPGLRARAIRLPDRRTGLSTPRCSAHR